MFCFPEEFKLCLLRIGEKHNLPLEIVFLIFRFVKYSEKAEIDHERNFYENLIYFLCLDTQGSRVHNPFSENGKKNIKKSQYQWCRSFNSFSELIYKKDLYNYRIPKHSSILWAIDNSSLKRRNNLYYYSEIPFHDYREKLLYEIRIIGKKNYLLEYEDNDVQNYRFVERRHLKECSLKKKILYLNTSPWKEIEQDFDEFSQNTINENDITWSLVVDNIGDSYYM